jgi:hypothetical protein
MDGGTAMPHLIWFLLTRLSAGFAIGSVAGLAIWRVGSWGAGIEVPDYYVAQGMFVYLFGSTIAAGYLATALWLDEPLAPKVRRKCAKPKA